MGKETTLYEKILTKLLNNPVIATIVIVSLTLTFLFDLLNGFNGTKELLPSCVDKKQYISTEPLDRIEKKYYLNLQEDSIVYNNLIDLYCASNKALIDTLIDLKDKSIIGKKIQTIIYVSGTSGYGKTTLFDYICTNVLVDDYIKIELTKDIFKKDPSIFKIEMTPDLTVSKELADNTDIIISRLPEIVETNITAIDFLKRFQKYKNQKFIIIDDLDEANDKTAYQIITEFEKFLEATTDKFLTVIIIGRPEIFHSYICRSNFHRNYTKSYIPYELKNKKTITRNDLTLRIENYAKRYQTDELISNKDDVLDKYIQCLKEYPFLTYSVHNLAIGNRVMGTIGNKNLAINEKSLKDAIYDCLLERGKEKHNRPSDSDPRDLELYKIMLQEVAVQYLPRIDTTSGYFTVSKSDIFSVEYEGETIKFYPERVLNRSGLITIKPFKRESAQYMFYPFWIHSYLIDEYNNRLKNSK